jgi:DNA-binding NarL/FixJ family response regulator
MSVLKILVADDAPFIREIVKQILKDEKDFELVGEAKNGFEAIEQAVALKPDLIFMDIVMPELSGIKATEEIMKLIPHVKIIAFTTMDSSSIQKQAMKAGCLGYFKKPFSKSDFLAFLETMRS